MSKVKKAVYQNPLLNKFIVPVYHRVHRSKNFSSKQYWENRYKKGGTSGAGSYGRLAKFKAQVLNDFVKKNRIKSVIEFGVGDGSQLKLFKFSSFMGLDVSKTSIELCKRMYKQDKTKSFYLYDPEYFVDNHRLFSADLALSLDVIYHLVEDKVFNKYMADLFASAKSYVIIYASDTDENKRNQAQHVRHRKFSDWVKQNQKSWRLVEQIENKYRLKTDFTDESAADFYIYQKKSAGKRRK